MSKELDIIAECQFDGWGHRMHAGAWETFVECTCGWTRGFPSTSDLMQIKRLHAAHVVSRLSDAGYSIVPSIRVGSRVSVSGNEGTVIMFGQTSCFVDFGPNIGTYVNALSDCIPLAAAAAAAEEEKP